MRYSAFSLIETLIALSILVFAIYFISPVYFKINDLFAIRHEIEQVKSFIYQIQSKARYTKQNYTLTVSQNENDGKWCIVALKKNSSKQVVCNCLNIISCPIEEYLVYYNHFNRVKLVNNSLYPKAFINIDGISGRLESKCIRFEIDKQNDILQLEQNGLIYVMPKNKRSSCKA